MDNYTEYLKTQNSNLDKMNEIARNELKNAYYYYFMGLITGIGFSLGGLYFYGLYLIQISKP